MSIRSSDMAKKSRLKKLLVWVCLAVVSMLAYRVVRPFFYCGDQMDETFADYRALKANGFANCFSLKEMVPSTAREINFNAKGGILGLGWFAKFSCKVSEQEFRSFCKERKYEIVEDGYRNANPATHAEDPNYGGMGGMPCPQHFLSYSYVKGNYGGLWLVFDCDTSTLTGCYSSN